MKRSFARQIHCAFPRVLLSRIADPAPYDFLAIAASRIRLRERCICRMENAIGFTKPLRPRKDSLYT
jgi:hypothetical protein